MGVILIILLFAVPSLIYLLTEDKRNKESEKRHRAELQKTRWIYHHFDNNDSVKVNLNVLLKDARDVVEKEIIEDALIRPFDRDTSLEEVTEKIALRRSEVKRREILAWAYRVLEDQNANSRDDVTRARDILEKGISYGDNKNTYSVVDEERFKLWKKHHKPETS